MSTLLKRMQARGLRTFAETKGDWQRDKVPDAADRIVTVMSRYVLDGDLPDRIASFDDLEECRLIIANVRAFQEDLGSTPAYEEAQSLVRDLNRYWAYRHEAVPTSPLLQ